MQMTTDEKESVKQLFFGALDFMYLKFEDKYLDDYINICKAQLKETGISVFEFNGWVEEWEVNKNDRT